MYQRRWSERGIQLPAPNPATARVWMGAQEDARRDTLGVTATISGHCRHGLADGEQRVALRPIITNPESTARCVPRAPLRVVSTIEGARGVSGTVQTWYRGPGNLGNLRIGRGFKSVEVWYCLPLHPEWQALFEDENRPILSSRRI